MNLLRKSSLTMFVVQLTFWSFGQTTTQQLTLEEISNRVAYVYGSDFVVNHPDLVIVYGKLMTNRITYQTAVQDQNEKYPLLSSFSLITKNNSGISPVNPGTFSLETFNPLTYDFGFFRNETLIIRIDGTNFLMIVKPQ